MKNKTFISFCINLLVGVLFSFPVFSAQSNAYNICIIKGEFNIVDNETGCRTISDVNGSSHKYYPEDRSNVFSQNKLAGNNNPGSKDKIQSEYSPPGFKKQFITGFSLCQHCLNPTFVNLSFLKDLRTTKMLC